MTRSVRVTMTAKFKLNTYMPDWRDTADLDVAERVLNALFEEVEIELEGEEMGRCICPPPDVEELLTGRSKNPNPDCHWHGRR